MRRIRQRLTFANVVSVIALFVALGGTALASVIISSNSQVASGTIAGHKPPSGKHANIIAGSIDGQDVAPNSLGGTAINEASLAGNARKLIYKASPSATATTLAAAGPYTIKARCFISGGVQLRAVLIADGPAGTEDVMYNQTNDDNPSLGGSTVSSGYATPGNTDFTVVRVEAEPPDHNRAAGTAMLRSGAALVQVDFNTVADSRNPESCHIYGTATNGS
jgi:hypothetical protein